MPEESDLISIDEAVVAYRRSRKTLFSWLRDGRLTRYRSAGDLRTFVSRAELAELVRHRVVEEQ